MEPPTWQLPPDQIFDEDKDSSSAKRERRSRRFILGVLAFAVILALLLLVLIHTANDTSNVVWRNKWASLLAHGTKPLRRHALAPIPPENHRLFTTSVSGQVGPCSCLFFPRPFPDKAAQNWLSLPLARGQEPPRNVIYFHGASNGNESYLRELGAVAKYFNVSVVSVEFPGFDDRSPYSTTTEDSLLNLYPVEVDEVVRQHLGWNWNDTVAWCNCFGVAIGLNALWRTYQRHLATSSPAAASHLATELMPAAIFMSKTLVSFRYAFQNLLKRMGGSVLSQVIPRDLFSLVPAGNGAERELSLDQEQMFRHFTCPVLAATGVKDRVCPISGNQLVLDQFANASLRRMTSLPGVHHCNTMDVIAKVHRRVTRTANVTPTR